VRIGALQLYSELMTCLQLGYPAGKARFKAANAALLSAVANMSVAEMAQFLGLARAASAVLQPDVRSAVVDQLHKLELLGGYVPCGVVQPLCIAMPAIHQLLCA
jgi:hypothetical protein